MSTDLLFIEDDEAYNYVLTHALSRRGFNVHSATTLEQGLDQAKEFAPNLIVLDLNLNGHCSLNLIPSLLDLAPGAKILVLTGYASISTAVTAVKLGAWDYLTKPSSVDIIITALTTSDKTNAIKTPKKFMSLQRMEWEYIQRVLSVHKGNIAATARALNMHRRTLQRKLIKRPPVS